MKLDNEEQRALLIQLLDMATFPGVFRQRVYALGVAIEVAGIEELTDQLEKSQSLDKIAPLNESAEHNLLGETPPDRG